MKKLKLSRARVKYLSPEKELAYQEYLAEGRKRYGEGVDM